MAKQLTIRGVSEELARRLEALSADRDQSVNTTVLELLDKALGIEHRRERLQRYATWTPEELEEFETELKAQRNVDAKLWQ